MNENLKAWIHELRTTDKYQGQEYLVSSGRSSNGDNPSFCCLGIGELLRGASFTEMLHSDAAYVTRDFVDWLGIAVEDEPDDWKSYSYDLAIDWPRSIVHRDSSVGATCVWLNDNAKLTFSQIADVIEYFGIRSAIAT